MSINQDDAARVWEHTDAKVPWESLTDAEQQRFIADLATVLERGPVDDPNGCGDCGGPVEVWFTDNVIWNEVMGGPGTLDDPGGYLCIACFITRAEKVLDPVSWKVTPRWPWRYRS